MICLLALLATCCAPAAAWDRPFGRGLEELSCTDKQGLHKPVYKDCKTAYANKGPKAPNAPVTFDKGCFQYSCPAPGGVTASDRSLTVKTGSTCEWSNVLLIGADGKCAARFESSQPGPVNVACDKEYTVIVKQGQIAGVTLGQLWNGKIDDCPASGNAKGAVDICDWCQFETFKYTIPCKTGDPDTFTSTVCQQKDTTTCKKETKYNAACTCIYEYYGNDQICRGVAGNICDPPEKCAGTLGCPTDEKASTDTKCGDATTDAALPCDADDYCDGAGKCVDKVQPVTHSCRGKDPLKPCDAEDFCDGTTKGCTDKPANAGTNCQGDRPLDATGCDAPDKCDAAGKCVDKKQPVDTNCQGDRLLDNTGCDAPDKCDAAGKCVDKKEDVGHVCGPKTSDPCDADDKCDAEGKCVVNFAPSSTLCLAADPNNKCDVNDYCTGTSLVCDPKYKPKETSCQVGDLTGPCDKADECDANGNCIDLKQDDTYVCRPAKGCCDLPDKCNGYDKTCTEDKTLGDGVTCATLAVEGAAVCPDCEFKCQGIHCVSSKKSDTSEYSCPA